MPSTPPPSPASWCRWRMVRSTATAARCITSTTESWMLWRTSSRRRTASRSWWPTGSSTIWSASASGSMSAPSTGRRTSPIGMPEKSRWRWSTPPLPDTASICRTAAPQSCGSAWPGRWSFTSSWTRGSGGRVRNTPLWCSTLWRRGPTMRTSWGRWSRKTWARPLWSRRWRPGLEVSHEPTCGKDDKRLPQHGHGAWLPPAPACQLSRGHWGRGHRLDELLLPARGAGADQQHFG